MGRIKIEVMSWLTTECGYNKPGNLSLEEEIEDGETIGVILGRISIAHHPLAECIIDKETQGFRDYVSIVINDRLIQQLKAPGEKLRDGDTVRLFPTVEGG